jgi:aquaporin Z
MAPAEIRASSLSFPEYLMEAAALGLFMISACLATALFEFPNSPVHRAIPDPDARRILTGILMGFTAIAIIYSPWGQQSGAHMNPAVTLTFLSLGKIRRADAVGYIVGQFAGGLAGVLLAAMVIGAPIRHPAVNFAVTVPGAAGTAVAFCAEFLISGLMMTTVLIVSNRKRLSRYTPLFAGTLVAVYIFIEGPLSGMSMNPARTVASAAPANVWTALWIYFAAPVLGMVLAGRLYKRFRGARVFCAKLHHHNDKRCIFRCNYGAM